MAIYRFSAKIVKRSDGRSATAAAAYRAGAVIPDERTGRVFDYTRRRGVAHTEILAPSGTPPRMLSRISLWNAVEAAERRHDAQVAREIELALPHELDAAARLELVREFVRREFVARGMIADLAVHRPDRRGDGRNHHAHVMLTLRPLAGDGLGPKAREWNDTALLEHWRAAWSASVNTALAAAGASEHVDHRSYSERGLPFEPEPKMGPIATAIERRGRISHAGHERRAVRSRNRKRAALIAELSLLTAKLETLDGAGKGRSETAARAAPVEVTVVRPSRSERRAHLRILALPTILPGAPAGPDKRASSLKRTAGLRRYLFALWTTVARAVTFPLRMLVSGPCSFSPRRRKPTPGG